MSLSVEQYLSMDWEDLVELGVNKSVSNGITLSVFKGICREIFPLWDFENDEWDEEDFWTHRFENWCTEILRWKDDYPINKSTCLEWAEEYIKGVYE